MRQDAQQRTEPTMQEPNNASNPPAADAQDATRDQARPPKKKGSMLVNLAVIIGLVFLVVPGLFLMACLSVALPARVAEGPTVVNAMRRSFELTKGSRWQILGIILIGALIFFVPSMVNELVVVSQWPFVGNVVFLPVVTAILYVLMAVIPPVMYEELVALKGGRPDLTSEIFA